MSAKHTPSPWKWAYSTTDGFKPRDHSEAVPCELVSADGSSVIELFSEDAAVNAYAKVSEADRRLIAAAPSQAATGGTGAPIGSEDDEPEFVTAEKGQQGTLDGMDEPAGTADPQGSR